MLRPTPWSPLSSTPARQPRDFQVKRVGALFLAMTLAAWCSSEAVMLDFKEPWLPLTTVTWCNWVTGGDLNGDGKPDIVAVNSGANSVSIFLGDGAGHFGTRSDVR